MDLQTLSWVLNGVLGICMYLLKNTHSEIRAHLKENRDAILVVKDTYFKKEDFKEFKEDLWKRLDRIEQSVSDKG